jgi:EmrB/QacA subfamily drug resistance transporter
MRRVVLIPLIVACAFFMEYMDSTVLATALPAIAADIGVNPLALKLAVTAYLVSLAVFIPISGWVADRIGSRTVFAAAMLVFMSGSLLCAASSTLPAFVAARFFQGMGGAMMVPVGRLVLLRSVPKSELLTALNYLTMSATLGPVMGPPLGGLITEYFNWRGIFLINVPVSILGIILVLAYIPNFREPEVPPPDVRGFVLAGMGFSSLVLGLSALGGHLLAKQVTTACIIAGALFLWSYWRHSLRVAHPLLSLGLMKIVTYRAGVIGGTLFRTGGGAVPFLLPLMFQLGFGLSPFQSGLLSCATSIGSLFIRTSMVFILRSFGFKTVLTVNAILSSAAIAAYGLFTENTSHALIFAVLLVTGSLRALQYTSAHALSYADVTQDVMSQATSLSTMAQRLAQSMGVAFGAYALELSNTFQGHAKIVTLDFWPAFLTVALISASSLFFQIGLPKHAGAELSGHGRT